MFHHVLLFHLQSRRARRRPSALSGQIFLCGHAFTVDAFSSTFFRWSTLWKPGPKCWNTGTAGRKSTFYMGISWNGGELTSPIGFLFLKLPPPPCAVLLVNYLFLGTSILGHLHIFLSAFDPLCGVGKFRSKLETELEPRDCTGKISPAIQEFGVTHCTPGPWGNIN